MTRKQRKKFINELVDLELTLESDNLTSENRNQIEERIMQITRNFHGLTEMLEVDEEVQSILIKKQQEN